MGVDEASGLGRLLRSEATSQRATFLELFFDLVFIFALTRVSQRIIIDLTGDRRILLTEAGETLILFLAVWLVWSTTVWATSQLDPDLPAVQAMVVVAMFGSMLMAVALPEGFGVHGLLFAGAFAALQIIRAFILLRALRARPARWLGRRALIWSVASGLLWITGGVFSEGPARGAVWTAALAVGYGGVALGYPVPRLGRSPVTGQPIASEHLAERYQQFLLIALGEMVLGVGLTYSGGAFTPARSVGFVLAFGTTVLLWRIYFHRAGHLLPAAIGRARDPARLGGTLGLAHLLMIIGVVLTGVGYELFIDHPAGPPDRAWLAPILGGPALFLIGRAYFEWLVFDRVSGSRVVAVALLGALAVALRGTPPLAVGAATGAVLLGVAVTDTRRSRRGPVEQPVQRI
ncbi:low temperature requirement protein A [Solwaraspora sp. WMMD1047]|uniref:low temperature requirement protein A n=1 Tax=Solwaraspora sp. WMMD1047 TaxID=3016102 RepID=UPI0024160A1C|nr:low temperature requirement protein A [Solwaraspora sp. WMMD1047]MDG4829771.1 low temperature requirement protein A [Solwaraspora sp. WMMD1047]